MDRYISEKGSTIALPAQPQSSTANVEASREDFVVLNNIGGSEGSVESNESMDSHINKQRFLAKAACSANDVHGPCPGVIVTDSQMNAMLINKSEAEEACVEADLTFRPELTANLRSSQLTDSVAPSTLMSPFTNNLEPTVVEDQENLSKTQAVTAHTSSQRTYHHEAFDVQNDPVYAEIARIPIQILPSDSSIAESEREEQAPLPSSGMPCHEGRVHHYHNHDYVYYEIANAFCNEGTCTPANKDVFVDESQGW